jgi:hypothetical protein
MEQNEWWKIRKKITKWHNHAEMMPPKTFAASSILLTLLEDGILDT